MKNVALNGRLLQLHMSDQSGQIFSPHRFFFSNLNGWRLAETLLTINMYGEGGGNWVFTPSQQTKAISQQGRQPYEQMPHTVKERHVNVTTKFLEGLR